MTEEQHTVCPDCAGPNGTHRFGCPTNKTVAQQEAAPANTETATSQPKGINIAEEMAKETPMNDFFHKKFNDTTEGIPFADKKSVFMVRQLCYAFFLEGLKSRTKQ